MRRRIKNLIASTDNRQAPLQEMKALIKNQGHRGLPEDGLIKASKGLTSIEEVMRVACVEQEF